MLSYDGSMTQSSRHSHHVMETDEIDGYIGAISISEADELTDEAIDNAYTPDVYDTDGLNEVADFADVLNSRAEISKMMGSIGSTTVDNTACSIFSHPFSGTLDNLRTMLTDSLGEEAIANVESQVMSAMAPAHQKGINKELLLKLWVVDEDLAKGAIDRNTQLCKHHSTDSSLSHFFISLSITSLPTVTPIVSLFLIIFLTNISCLFLIASLILSLIDSTILLDVSSLFLLSFLKSSRK